MNVMVETILITGSRSPFGTELTNLYLTGGHRVLSTYPAGEESPQPGAEADENLIPIPWNRRSPISGHWVLLESLKHCQHIDEALIVFEPHNESRPLHEIPAADTEWYFDTYLKGNIFLIKELLAYFQKQRRGRLSISVQAAESGFLAPFDACAAGGLRQFAGSLFSLYQNEPLVIDGFESRSTDTEGFAEFIYRTRRERGGSQHGKWHRYNDKSVLNALGFVSHNR